VTRNPGDRSKGLNGFRKCFRLSKGFKGFRQRVSERRLGRPIARRAPEREAVTIPVGEQLNLLQYVSCHRICH
jgi:hypothetical protein